MIRLYTEDVNRAGTIAILDKDFPGYTVIPTLGRWNGQDEKSLMVEVAGESLPSVESAAREIKTANHQESVMVTEDSDEKTKFV